MTLKKVFLVLLASLIAVSFSACGEKSDDGIQTWHLGEEDFDYDQTFSQPDEFIAADIYNSVEYTEDMLYGVYSLNNEEKDIKDIRKTITFNDVEFNEGVYNITSLPISVSSGKDYICDKINSYQYSDFENIEDKEIAVLEFATKDDVGTVVCSYEVDGNKVKYQSLEQINKSGEDFSYENNIATFEYEFSISGPYLTLSNGNKSIKLTGYTFSDNCDSDLWLSGYSLPDTPLFDNLDYFSVSEGYFNYSVDRTGEYYEEQAVELSDDGIINIYLKKYDEDPVIKQFAYIANCSGSTYLNNFSIILLDGEKVYYYTDSVTMREARQLPDGSKLTDDKAQEIAEKKTDLFEDLRTQLKTNGIEADINRATGEIALDTSVLFGGDSAELTNEGKEFLKKFLKVYIDIIYSKKYDGFISKTIIEGHVAPISGVTYESGLPLSEQRAENVKNYCLSDEIGVDTSKLASTLETKGYSQSRPVYDSNGEADIEASRRVSFTFVVNVDSQ